MSISVGPYGPGSKYNEAKDRRSLKHWRAGTGTHAYTGARLKWYACPGNCWPYLDEKVEINGGFECNMGGLCFYSHPKIRLTGSDTQSTVTFEGIQRGTRVPQWPILLRLSGFCGRAEKDGARAPFGVAEAVQRLNDSGVPDIHLRVRGDHPEALRMRREIEQNCAHEQGETVCEDCGGLVGSFMGEEDDAFLDSVNASGCSCGSSGDLVADALGSADAANTTAAAAEPSVPSEARAAKRQRQQRQAEEDSEEEEEDSDAEEIHRSLARAKQRAKARGEEW